MKALTKSVSGVKGREDFQNESTTSKTGLRKAGYMEALP